MKMNHFNQVIIESSNENENIAPQFYTLHKAIFSFLISLLSFYDTYLLG